MSFGEFWLDYFAPGELQRLVYAAFVGVAALGLGAQDFSTGIALGFVLPKHLAADCYALAKLFARGWSG